VIMAFKLILITLLLCLAIFSTVSLAQQSVRRRGQRLIDRRSNIPKRIQIQRKNNNLERKRNALSDKAVKRRRLLFQNTSLRKRKPSVIKNNKDKNSNPEYGRTFFERTRATTTPINLSTSPQATSFVEQTTNSPVNILFNSESSFEETFTNEIGNGTFNSLKGKMRKSVLLDGISELKPDNEPSGFHSPNEQIFRISFKKTSTTPFPPTEGTTRRVFVYRPGKDGSESLEDFVRKINLQNQIKASGEAREDSFKKKLVDENEHAIRKNMTEKQQLSDINNSTQKIRETGNTAQNLFNGNLTIENTDEKQKNKQETKLLLEISSKPQEIEEKSNPPRDSFKVILSPENGDAIRKMMEDNQLLSGVKNVHHMNKKYRIRRKRIKTNSSPNKPGNIHLSKKQQRKTSNIFPTKFNNFPVIFPTNESILNQMSTEQSNNANKETNLTNEYNLERENASLSEIKLVPRLDEDENKLTEDESKPYSKGKPFCNNTSFANLKKIKNELPKNIKEKIQEEPPIEENYSTIDRETVSDLLQGKNKDFDGQFGGSVPVSPGASRLDSNISTVQQKGEKQQHQFPSQLQNTNLRQRFQTNPTQLKPKKVPHHNPVHRFTSSQSSLFDVNLFPSRFQGNSALQSVDFRTGSYSIQI